MFACSFVGPGKTHQCSRKSIVREDLFPLAQWLPSLFPKLVSGGLAPYEISQQNYGVFLSSLAMGQVEIPLKGNMSDLGLIMQITVWPKLL